MKTVEIKQSSKSIKICNLDATQIVAKGSQIINTKLFWFVALASTIIHSITEGARNYIYEAIKAVMLGAVAVDYTFNSFTKGTDFADCLQKAQTAGEVGLLYFDSEEKKMYISEMQTVKTLDAIESRTLHTFTLIPAGEDPDITDAEIGDLYYITDDDLFYEVQQVSGSEEKELTPISAEEGDLYREVENGKIYTYEGAVLEESVIVYFAEQPTDAEIEDLELNTIIYIATEGKTYKVVEAEDLGLTEYTESIDTTALWQNTTDNGIFEYVGGDMVQFTAVDLTDLEDGHIIVTTL